MEEYDAEKVVACMFDPSTSGILARLEDGPKALSLLAAESGMSEGQILESMSYLLEHKFVALQDGGKTLAADGDKLASIVEGSESFDGAVDSLTTMDSYLN